MIETENTFVFIPGAWHGGWAYDSITKKMEKNGRKCFSLTLPGLELQSETQNQIINLDTHIQYVVDVLVKEKLDKVFLCGHSYAGLVITGVADKIPQRIYALVYIDAYIPKNGDYCWKLTSEEYRHHFTNGASYNGFTVADFPNVDNRRRPHPLATFMQSLHLTGNYQRVHNRTFIYLTGWTNTPFKKQYETLKDSSEWRILTV